MNEHFNKAVIQFGQVASSYKIAPTRVTAPVTGIELDPNDQKPQRIRELLDFQHTPLSDPRAITSQRLSMSSVGPTLAEYRQLGIVPHTLVQHFAFMQPGDTYIHRKVTMALTHHLSMLERDVIASDIANLIGMSDEEGVAFINREFAKLREVVEGKPSIIRRGVLGGLAIGKSQAARDLGFVRPEVCGTPAVQQRDGFSFADIGRSLGARLSELPPIADRLRTGLEPSWVEQKMELNDVIEFRNDMAGWVSDLSTTLVHLMIRGGGVLPDLAREPLQQMKDLLAWHDRSSMGGIVVIPRQLKYELYAVGVTNFDISTWEVK